MGNASMSRTFTPHLPEMETPEVTIPMAEEARSRWLLNPPPSRTVERTAHHLRDFTTWETSTILLLLENVERKLAELAPLVDKPPVWMTGDAWENACAKVGEWGSIIAAGRKVLAGRSAPVPTGDG